MASKAATMYKSRVAGFRIDKSNKEELDLGLVYSLENNYSILKIQVDISVVHSSWTFFPKCFHLKPLQPHHHHGH